MTKYGFRDNSITTKKLMVKGLMPVQYVIEDAVVISTSALLSGYDLATKGTSAIDNTIISVQPPYPSKLRFQFGSSAKVSTNTLTVVGIDASGETVTDSIACPQTLGSTVDTSNAYGRITSITSNAVSDSDDVSLGYSTTIGLPYPLASTGDILTYTTDSTAGTSYNKTGGLTIDKAYDTLILPTLTAGSTVTILYLTQVQE